MRAIMLRTSNMAVRSTIHIHIISDDMSVYVYVSAQFTNVPRRILNSFCCPEVEEGDKGLEFPMHVSVRTHQSVIDQFGDISLFLHY